MKILDVGCGTGVVLTELAKRGDATGFDFSDKALEYCRNRGHNDLVLGNAEELPFESETFDAVVGLDIFEHVEHDERAFAEVRRVLKPGGILILSVPAFQSLWGPHDVALMHFRRYRRREMADKLKRAGLEPLKVSYSVFLLFPLVACIRFFEKRKRGPAEASLPPLPVWLNSALIALQTFESKLLNIANLPWGSSVIAVARKPS
jgi:ubiquinone/menaquinone biosynthesis C-methylase UbiE